MPHKTYRGRDAHYCAPPAQIRTCPIKAYGSHLGCLTANRLLGQGCRIRGFGSHCASSLAIRRHVADVRWLRCRSERSQIWLTLYLNVLKAALLVGTA